ncbi:integral membrane protein [Salix suchowensis]|nr:integral membrane protein [Salix suchowensis]
MVLGIGPPSPGWWICEVPPAGTADGFEYNLLFRKHEWHASSKLSSGAFVRRRRWLRLMVRPARQDTHKPSNHTNTTMMATPILCVDPFEAYPREVFMGDDADEDWKRCHALLKTAGRDGKKLELWHRWLGLKHMDLSRRLESRRCADMSSRSNGQRTASPYLGSRAHDARIAHVPISDPPVQQIGAVLKIHANHIMESFVYPESRAHLVELFALAGALPYITQGRGDTSSWFARSLDFYSYIKDLEIRDEVEEFGGSTARSARRSLAHRPCHPANVFPRFITFAGPVTAAICPQPRRTKIHRLDQIQRPCPAQSAAKGAGHDGFAFAMTLAIAGGEALNRYFSAEAYAEVPAESNPTAEPRPTFHSLLARLSAAQRTFVANLVSSAISILLIQAGRDRSLRLRNNPPSMDAIPLTVSIPHSSRSGVAKGACLNSVGRRLAEFVPIISTRLPRAYVKWISSLAAVDPRLPKALRAIRTGRWSYIHAHQRIPSVDIPLTRPGIPPAWGDPSALPAFGGPAANVTWAEMGVHNRSGIGGIPCELVHGGITSRFGLDGSCTANAAVRGAYAFAEAMAIYLPSFWVALARYSNPQSHFRASRSRTKRHIPFYVCVFVLFYGVRYAYTRLRAALSFCVARLLGRAVRLYKAACLTCGSSIWIENGRRRGEMALYVLPRAIRTLLPNSWLRGNRPLARGLER